MREEERGGEEQEKRREEGKWNKRKGKDGGRKMVKGERFWEKQMREEGVRKRGRRRYEGTKELKKRR